MTPGPVESSKRLDRSGGPGSRIGALAQRVPAQAQQAVADVVRILAAVVGRLRSPLLVVLLLPVILGVLLVAVSAIRGGADLPIACVLALLAVVPSGWLAIRRRQLLVALQPPEQAGAEIYAIFSAPQVLATVKSNLIEVAARSSGLGFRSLGRSVWKGVRITNEMRGRAVDSPRLAPFLPGRLRGLVMLAGSCVLATVVLGGFLVLKVLATAVGLG